MSDEGLHSFRILDIASSGMAAERKRLEVVTANIANAETLKTPEGGPYRRREVVFQSVMDDFARDHDGLPMVEVGPVRKDNSEFKRVLMKGHPEADAEGYVRMPNIDLMFEMVDLMASMRSYEANMRSVRAFRTMVDAALQIGRV
jgi:flagellar basal-body rod protein FlgC